MTHPDGTNGHAVVGTTIPAFAMDDEDIWGAWLYNAKAMMEDYPDVEFFAALEIDGRGKDRFQPLLDRVAELGIPFTAFYFLIDDGAREIHTANRLRRITTGQNLTNDFCRGIPHCQWLLFMAADACPPANALTELTAVDHPIVGGQLDTYGLDGPKITVPGHPDWDLRQHMATAAFVLIHRDIFNAISWRWDLDNGRTDDPCLEFDARTLLGFPTVVRHDVRGQHYPEIISSIETRFPGRDMSWHEA